MSDITTPFTSRPAARRGRSGPMTANQRNTLRSCMIDKAEIQGRDLQQADDMLDTWLAELGADTVNGFNRASKHISETIAWLKEHRAALKAVPAPPLPGQPVASNQPANEIEDGFYELPTDSGAGVVGQPRIAKVQHAVHGSGNQYAKILDLQTGLFLYEPGLIGDVRRSGSPLTLERARHLGQLYGRCVICGATLTDELSIALSIGPVCGKRIGGQEFTDMARVTRKQLRMARVLPTA